MQFLIYGTLPLTLNFQVPENLEQGLSNPSPRSGIQSIGLAHTGQTGLLWVEHNDHTHPTHSLEWQRCAWQKLKMHTKCTNINSYLLYLFFFLLLLCFVPQIKTERHYFGGRPLLPLTQGGHWHNGLVCLLILFSLKGWSCLSLQELNNLSLVWYIRVHQNNHWISIIIQTSVRSAYTLTSWSPDGGTLPMKSQSTIKDILFTDYIIH